MWAGNHTGRPLARCLPWQVLFQRPPVRATEGVINFDIARVLLDPDAFIATAIYEDGAALERQESLPEVDRVMAMLPESLAAPPERTIFDASVNPALV
jgi:quinol monooxygenase YgiN